jgi:hypothetical protein
MAIIIRTIDFPDLPNLGWVLAICWRKNEDFMDFVLDGLVYY